MKRLKVAKYVINSVDNTKLPCYTLPPTKQHSFFRNLPPLLVQDDIEFPSSIYLSLRADCNYKRFGTGVDFFAREKVWGLIS